jgi:hypothetical protein
MRHGSPIRWSTQHNATAFADAESLPRRTARFRSSAVKMFSSAGGCVLSADVRKGKKHSIGWLQRLRAVSVAGDAGRQAWTIVCRRAGEPDR